VGACVVQALEPNHVQVAHRGPAWVQKESGRGKEEPLSFSSLKAAEQVLYSCLFDNKKDNNKKIMSSIDVMHPTVVSHL
jgi:hypothetical protein